MIEKFSAVCARQCRALCFSYELISRKRMSMYNLPLTANNTGMLSKIAKPTQEAQNESNRYCKKNRRPRQSRHSEGNQKNNADPGGRPLIENIDTGNCVLFRDAGDRRERIHRVNTVKLPSDWKSGGSALLSVNSMVR